MIRADHADPILDRDSHLTHRLVRRLARALADLVASVGYNGKSPVERVIYKDQSWYSLFGPTTGEEFALRALPVLSLRLS